VASDARASIAHNRAQRRPKGSKDPDGIGRPGPKGKSAAMSAHELARLRERYDRQTAVWNQLRERFAALPQEKIRVANELLEELSAPVSTARTARSVAGVRV
jgi:hypothetical protein